MGMIVKKEYTATYTRTYEIDVLTGIVQIVQSDSKYGISKSNYIQIPLEDWPEFIGLIQQTDKKIKDRGAH